MADAPQHGPTPPAPGQLTVGLALAGVRPRQMRDDEWAAMHEASTGYCRRGWRGWRAEPTHWAREILERPAVLPGAVRYLDDDGGF